LSAIANTILSTLPDGVNNLDITISGDGKYLFNLQSGAGAVGVFTINPDGTLNQFGDIEGLPKTAASTALLLSNQHSETTPARMVQHLSAGVKTFSA
jgi:hypothetical protein